jgi:hypothetical protein
MIHVYFDRRGFLTQPKEVWGGAEMLRLLEKYAQQGNLLEVRATVGGQQ